MYLNHNSMAGRRRDARYGLSAPLEGSFRVTRNVVIEHREGRELCVISDAPETIGQRWTFGADATSHDAVTVRLEECRSITVDGQPKYRLRFAVVSG